MKIRLKLSPTQWLGGCYGVLVLLLSFALAWSLMQNFNFFYGIWHDHGGIKEGIERFGPKNRFKRGFENTTPAQRNLLFSQIVYSIHHGGEGLSDITYQSSSSGGEQTLLREPELVHLQDVANLIDTLKVFVLVLLLFWLIFTMVLLRKHRQFPAFNSQLLGLLAVFGLLALLLVIFGPETIFNYLHIWVFPDEHQWFFYYQESLMSTMMYAPLLFAWIAGAWVFIATAIFIAFNLIAPKVARLVFKS